MTLPEKNYVHENLTREERYEMEIRNIKPMDLERKLTDANDQILITEEERMGSRI